MSEPRLPDLARSFERHLRAENKSDRTVETHLEAVRLLEAYLAHRGVGLADADRAQIEAFLADPARPLEADDSCQPLPLPQGVLPLA
jgi:Phage integrase, N-terminal SAM-like domain